MSISTSVINPVELHLDNRENQEHIDEVTKLRAEGRVHNTQPSASSRFMSACSSSVRPQSS